MGLIATPQTQRGFTLIEMLVTLIVGVFVTIGSAHAMQRYYASLAAEATATHLRIIADAAKEYIRDNKAALLTAADVATPAIITPADLADGGYTPSGFNAVNNFGQSFEVRAIEPVEGELQSLILTTGGDVIDGMAARNIAQMIGTEGGFIPIDAATTAQGAQGSWNVSLTPFQASPGVGRLAVALFMQEAIAAAAASTSIIQVVQSEERSVEQLTGNHIQAVYAICPDGYTMTRGGYRQVFAIQNAIALPPNYHAPFVSEEGQPGKSWKVQAHITNPSCHGGGWQDCHAYYAWAECKPD